MTTTNSASPVLRQWQRYSRSVLGRWAFGRMVCNRAPYFGSIRPAFIELQPALCRVAMKKRRAVHNHLGTVHALAMGNLCELAAGFVTEVTIPQTMRWIPRGMTIEYLKPAETDLIAMARLDKNEWAAAENLGVPVSVVDSRGQEVVRAVISMYVSPRRAREAASQDA